MVSALYDGSWLESVGLVTVAANVDFSTSNVKSPDRVLILSVPCFGEEIKGGVELGTIG